MREIQPEAIHDVISSDAAEGMRPRRRGDVEQWIYSQWMAESHRALMPFLC